MGLPNQQGSASTDDWVEKHHTRLQFAHSVAKRSIEAATGAQKMAYDKKTKHMPLLPGERVLVRLRGLKGRSKIQDRWESTPYIVLQQPNTDIPVYEVQQEQTKKLKILHRNALTGVSLQTCSRTTKSTKSSPNKNKSKPRSPSLPCSWMARTSGHYA